MRYKCVVSDLDLTLLGPGSTLSEGTLKAINGLIAMGVHFVPASGRAFYSFPQNLLEIKGIQYAITSNGASIYEISSQTKLYETLLPAQVPEILFELLKDYPVTYEAFVDSVAYTEHTYYKDPQSFGVNQDTIAYVKATRHPVEDICQFTLEHKEALDCVDVIVPPERKLEVLELLRDNLAQAYITTSAPHLIELSSQDSGKHIGLKRLTELLNITMEEVVAFGDGDNDSEMLREAGLGICVKNASRACKEVADLETDYHHLDGVAKGIYRIFPELEHIGKDSL